MKKNLLKRFISTSFIGGLLLLNAGFSAAQTVMLDRVVAIVDEDLVLESELKTRTASVLERLQAQYNQLPPKEVLEKQILEQLILERVQLQLAQRYDIDPSAEEVDQAIARIAQRNQMTMEQLAAD